MLCYMLVITMSELQKLRQNAPDFNQGMNGGIILQWRQFKQTGGNVDAGGNPQGKTPAAQQG